ncbi:MAG: hypothetical protein Q9195_003274, partial [Heterodermia aff. obscurata]
MASLTTLPNELLATIVSLSLPRFVPRIYHAYSYHNSSALPNHPTGHAPANRYSVLYINKRIHATALHVLHCHQFRISINEFSFLDAPQQKADAHRWYKTRGPLTGHEANWTWQKAFPGLDLREIRELMVKIYPSSIESFWCSARSAVRALCERQLERRGPIRKLVIEVHDVTYSEIDRETAWSGGMLREVPKKGIRSEDYEDVLEPFKEVVSRAGQCEIRLPYWMGIRLVRKKRLLKAWGDLGAKVVFVPLDGPAIPSKGENWASAEQDL